MRQPLSNTKEFPPHFYTSQLGASRRKSQFSGQRAENFLLILVFVVPPWNPPLAQHIPSAFVNPIERWGSQGFHLALPWIVPNHEGNSTFNAG